MKLINKFFVAVAMIVAVLSTPLYCLQFANDGLWSTELKANKIGSIKIK